MAFDLLVATNYRVLHKTRQPSIRIGSHWDLCCRPCISRLHQFSTISVPETLISGQDTGAVHPNARGGELSTVLDFSKSEESFSCIRISAIGHSFSKNLSSDCVLREIRSAATGALPAALSWRGGDVPKTAYI